jgi:hypothetical protein
VPGQASQHRPCCSAHVAGRLASALRDGVLPNSLLGSRLNGGVLVLDEADLLMGYGYEDDLALLAPQVTRPHAPIKPTATTTPRHPQADVGPSRVVRKRCEGALCLTWSAGMPVAACPPAAQVPRGCQVILMSATLSPDVDRLTALLLHSPVSLDLTQPGAVAAGEGGEAAARDGTAAASTSAAAGLGAGVSTDIQHFYIQVRDALLLRLCRAGHLCSACEGARHRPQASGGSGCGQQTVAPLPITV